MLRAVADLDPHCGEVWLDELPRSRLTPPEWRRRVGLLPAESHWWAETVGEHWRAPAADAPIEPLLVALGFDIDVSPAGPLLGCPPANASVWRWRVCC
ncbi:MAG: hypothetical protein R3F40_14545 [Candidatus Competibacteraceae bacterium]